MRIRRECIWCGAWLLALAAGLSVLAGCTGNKPDVSKVFGRVTLNGKPLPYARVEFQPEKGRPSAGMTDENGNYTLDFSLGQSGALLGKHTVRISTGGERPDPATGEMKVFPELVPSKYNTQSELTVEVKSGKNELNFDLTSP